MTTVSAASNTPPAAGIATSSNTPAISSEYNTFIKLLTAQVRNQDPLAPLDSTQFVEQLATFSGLEQQVNSNAHLERIAAMMGDLTGLAAGQWLGQKVSFQSSWIPFSGDAVEFSADIPAGTERSVLTIRDAGGRAVWTETLDPSKSVHSWDGRAQSGGPAASGSSYEFSIDTYDASGQHTGSAAPRVITTVTTVGSEDGMLVVGTASNLSAQLASVQKLNDPTN
jgi:flagellar basal-body rod modification protein FlgD